MKNDVEAKPVEVDLSKFEVGASYDVPSLTVIDPDPNMYYFIAARNATGGNEAGTVGHCKVIGYTESKKMCSGITSELCLMEIPLWVREKREQSRIEKERETMNAFNKIPDGMVKLRGVENSVRQVRAKD